MQTNTVSNKWAFISGISLSARSKKDGMNPSCLKPEMVVNLLIVKGPRHALESLRREVEGFDPVIVSLRGKERHSVFCFSSVIEMPQSVLDTDSQIELGHKRIELWGTDSDAWGANLFKERENELIYSFTTKGIPAKIIEKLTRKCRHLKFSWTFRDDRVGLQGISISKNGDLINWNSK